MSAAHAAAGGGGAAGAAAAAAAARYVVITVQTVAGKGAEYEIDRESATVLDLKQAIAARDDVPLESQRLLDAGEPLDADSDALLLSGLTFFTRPRPVIHLTIAVDVAPHYVPQSASASDAKAPKPGAQAAAGAGGGAAAVAGRPRVRAVGAEYEAQAAAKAHAAALDAAEAKQPQRANFKSGDGDAKTGGAAAAAAAAAAGAGAAAARGLAAAPAGAAGAGAKRGPLDERTAAEEAAARKRMDLMKQNAAISAVVRRLATARDRWELMRLMEEEIDKLYEARDRATFVPSQWACPQCTYTNPRIAVTCEMCGALNPVDAGNGGRPLPEAVGDFAYQQLPQSDPIDSGAGDLGL